VEVRIFSAYFVDVILLQNLGKAEINNLKIRFYTFLFEQEVLWLDIPVSYALGMTVV